MNNPISIELLAKMPLFRGLSAVQLRRVWSFVRPRHFVTGASLISHGGKNDLLFFILSGTVKVGVINHHGQEAIFNILGFGEILGELSALEGVRHSADVRALEPTACLCLDANAFQTCLEEIPLLWVNLALIQGQRVRRLSDQNESLSLLDLPGRVAQQLLSFARTYGQENQEGHILIVVRLSQKDLAGLAGASRQRVNSVLTTYKRRGWIDTFRHSRIVILNREALRKRAQ